MSAVDAAPRQPASPAPVAPSTSAEPTTPLASVTRPEAPAEGTRIGAVVYFSSASGNTARFIAGCALPAEGIAVYRIPLRPTEGTLEVREPYVIVVPTYGGGDATKALPPQVRRFLNDRANRRFLRGVIASGNTNFGDAYCAAGDIIARRCHVPFLYGFELTGTPEDRRAVRVGLRDFFRSAPTESTRQENTHKETTGRETT